MIKSYNAIIKIHVVSILITAVKIKKENGRPPEKKLLFFIK